MLTSQEMLYKAKRMDNGEWVYWDAISGLHGVDIVPDTTCRYIGIPDKNGKKMWEHDIFRHYNRVGFGDYDHFVLGTVIWDEKHCRFTNKSWANNEIYLLNSECTYEVIGNVFDNSELLEEE